MFGSNLGNMKFDQCLNDSISYFEISEDVTAYENDTVTFKCNAAVARCG